MNQFRKGIFWAVLFVLFEASIRKYIYSAPWIVLVKYIFLAPLFLFAFRRPAVWSSTALVFITLPLLATIPSPSFIPYAIYDLISIFYLPVLLFCLALWKQLFPSGTAQKLLSLLAIIGILNSILIIIQSLVGPHHWLSQTVDQSFSVHAYGMALKAPGLAGASSPYMSIAGLIALDVLRRSSISKGQKGLIPFFQMLIAISVVFNLASRTYALGVVAFIIPSLLIPILINRRIDNSSLIFLLLPLAYFFLQSVAPEWGLTIFSANRTVDDYGSAANRLYYIPILYLFVINPFSLPLLDGLGLGYAVNNNPLSDPFYLPSFCRAIGIGTENEYERFICSFGAFGLLHILARLFLAAIAIRNASATLKPSFPASIASGWLFFSLTLCNGLLLRANDTATGTLLLLLALSSSQSLLATIDTERLAAFHQVEYPVISSS